MASWSIYGVLPLFVFFKAPGIWAAPVLVAYGLLRPDGSEIPARYPLAFAIAVVPAILTLLLGLYSSVYDSDMLWLSSLSALCFAVLAIQLDCRLLRDWSLQEATKAVEPTGSATIRR